MPQLARCGQIFSGPFRGEMRGRIGYSKWPWPATGLCNASRDTATHFFAERLMARSSAGKSGCSGFRQAARLSRREVLRVGSLVGFGLTLPMLLEQQARAAASGGTFGRAKSVISLFLHGGHPQQETFDPKPDGPSAVRGEFKA